MSAGASREKRLVPPDLPLVSSYGTGQSQHKALSRHTEGSAKWPFGRTCKLPPPQRRVAAIDQVLLALCVRTSVPKNQRLCAIRAQYRARIEASSREQRWHSISRESDVPPLPQALPAPRASECIDREPFRRKASARCPGAPQTLRCRHPPTLAVGTPFNDPVTS